MSWTSFFGSLKFIGKSNLSYFDRSSVLEELSVRSNLALSQKRALEMGEDEVEYIGLCAQVVSAFSFIQCFKLSFFNLLDSNC